jgi:hypothetical protein
MITSVMSLGQAAARASYRKVTPHHKVVERAKAKVGEKRQPKPNRRGGKLARMRHRLDLLGDLGGLSSSRLGRLGREELGLDGGKDTTLRDNDVTEKLVELFVVSDGELEVSRDESRFRVVSSGVTG